MQALYVGPWELLWAGRRLFTDCKCVVCAGHRAVLAIDCLLTVDVWFVRAIGQLWP